LIPVIRMAYYNVPIPRHACTKNDREVCKIAFFWLCIFCARISTAVSQITLKMLKKV